ncbi:MAG: serine/threonine-protein kinase, partial [Blastocatellia bacterium]
MFRAGYEIGPYRLVRKLGRGSFGEVWLAQRHTKITAINVALKIPITDVDINVIKQEADLWVQASGHSNVLPIIEAEIYDDQVVIVSEYAPDGSLQEWLNLHNGSAPSVESAVQMTLGILNGLEHLHGKKIIHRDLKPANILLQGNTPRLADFGLSRVVKSGSVSSIVAGTPEYMAPEAFKGKRNERTDLWSVGVILHQLVSGGLPFRSSDPLSMMAIIQDEEPAPLGEDVPSAIRTIVACSLSKDPMKRATCAAQMRGQLQEAMGQVKDAAGAAAERPPRDDRDHPGGKFEPLPRVGYDAIGAPQLRVWAGGVGVAPRDAETIPMGVSPATPKAASEWRWRWIVYAAAMALALGITILMVARKEWTRQPEFLTYQFQAVRIDGSGNVVERSPGKAFYFADDLDDGVILEMVEIPGGPFQMGSPEG